jgi:hypothetical protein
LFQLTWNGAFDSYNSPAIFSRLAYAATRLATADASTWYTSAVVGVVSGDTSATVYNISWCPTGVDASGWPAAVQAQPVGSDVMQAPLLYFYGAAHGGLSYAAAFSLPRPPPPPVGAWTGANAGEVLAVGIPYNTFAAHYLSYRAAYVMALADTMSVTVASVVLENYQASGTGNTLLFVYFLLPNTADYSTSLSYAAFASLFDGGDTLGSPAGALLVAALTRYGLPADAWYGAPPTRRRSLLTAYNGAVPWLLASLQALGAPPTRLRSLLTACNGGCLAPYDAVAAVNAGASLVVSFATTAALNVYAAPATGYAVAYAACVVAGCDYRTVQVQALVANAERTRCVYRLVFQNKGQLHAFTRAYAAAPASFVDALNVDAGLGVVSSTNLGYGLLAPPPPSSSSADNTLMAAVPPAVVTAAVVAVVLLAFCRRKKSS